MVSFSDPVSLTAEKAGMDFMSNILLFLLLG
jgi:hypothetical protein